MGHRLYSGNLEAYKCAERFVESTGLVVKVTHSYYDSPSMRYNTTIELYELNNTHEPFTVQRFCHRDIDIVYINMTEWLNRQAAAYESWKEVI